MPVDHLLVWSLYLSGGQVLQDTRHPSVCSTRSLSERRWRRRPRRWRRLLHHVTESHLVWSILHMYCIHQDNMLYIVIDLSNINVISLKNFFTYFNHYTSFLALSLICIDLALLLTCLPTYTASLVTTHIPNWCLLSWNAAFGKKLLTTIQCLRIC